MPRCFLPKKQKLRAALALASATANRRSPSPTAPSAAAAAAGDDVAQVNKNDSHVYRPPSPVNHAGKCVVHANCFHAPHITNSLCPF